MSAAMGRSTVRSGSYGLMRPHLYGKQPGGRYVTKKGGVGPLRWHAIGCRVDGGPGLPPGACHKCLETIDTRWTLALETVDRKGNARV